MRYLRALLIFLSALATCSISYAQERQFRQLKDTVGITFNQLESLCPRDGIATCSGSLAGWVWATEDQVLEFMTQFAPGLPATKSADPIPTYGAEGMEYFFYSGEFFQVIKPTFAAYLTYSTSEFAAGLTATLDINDVPMVGYASAGHAMVTIGGSMGIGPSGSRSSSDPYTGAFLWRDPSIPLPPQPKAIDAVNDTGTTRSPSQGGTIANVLNNDRLGGMPAGPGDLFLSVVSATSADISLDLSTGVASIRAGAVLGSHSLTYRICEKTFPDNCDTAVVSSEVRHFVIYAGPDRVKASNKVAAVLIANVLANDTLNGARATTSNVILARVSSTNRAISLNTSTGAVRLSKKIDSTTYTLVYKICERAAPANCAQGTVTIELSGGG